MRGWAGQCQPLFLTSLHRNFLLILLAFSKITSGSGATVVVTLTKFTNQYSSRGTRLEVPFQRSGHAGHVTFS
jgi:hypothetical protein